MFRFVEVDQAKKEAKEFIRIRSQGQKAPFPITRDGLAIVKNCEIVLWADRAFKYELLAMRSACLAWISEIKASCVDSFTTGERSAAGIREPAAILPEYRDLNTLAEGSRSICQIPLDSDWIDGDSLDFLVFLTLSLPSTVKEEHQLTNLREVARFATSIQNALRGIRNKTPVERLVADWNTTS